MPRLSKNSVSVRGRPLSYQRDQVDNEAAPASSGMRTRQRRRQSETRGLTLGSVLSAGQRRFAIAEGREFHDPSPLGFLSPAQQGRLSFFHGTAPFTSEPPKAKSRHGPSARAVIRIIVFKKIFVTLSGAVSLRASPVTLHIITSPG